MAETIRVNKEVSGFGSSKLRKPWYLRWTPESLHPFLKGLFRKNPNEWSDRENEKFMEAMTLAKKLKGVEDRMGLLNPDLDEQIDDPHLGEVEGMLAYKGDDYKGTLGPRWVDTDWSPEVIKPSSKDEVESGLDVIGREDQEREDKYFAGLLDYDDELETYDSAPEGSSGGAFFASGESGGESKGLSPMEKYGAKLVMDMFKEKEERPPQTIGASPIIPGRTMDMSKYVSSRRPSKERYRNLGLLARGTV